MVKKKINLKEDLEHEDILEVAEDDDSEMPVTNIGTTDAVIQKEIKPPELSEDSYFCDNCYNKEIETQVNKNNKFCPVCGVSLDWD